MGLDRPIDVTPHQRKTVLALLKRYLPNTTAWVYGSRVKWTSRPQSDLDLVVFTTPDQERRVSELREAFEESNLPFRVDLFVWDAVPEQFRKQIEAEHVVLVEKEEQGVPGGWHTKTFAAAPMEIIDGDRGENYPKQDEFFKHGYCMFLNAGNVTSNGFDFSSCVFITSEKDRRMRKGKLSRGDVVLTTRGTVGNSAYFDQAVPYNHIRINSGMVIFRAEDHALNSLYLYFFIRSKLFLSQIAALRTGSAQPQLPIRDINRVKIPIPPPPEQRAIAHILGTLDDKIELNRRMNETLEAMARALFKSWFVDFDPVRAKMAGRDPGLPQHLADLFPDRLVDAELGPIPEGWEVKTLGESFNLTMGQSPPGSTYNEQGEGLPFFQGRTDFGFRYPENRKFCTAPMRVAEPGDTLVSVRAPVGDINMAWEQCCIGRGIAALRHKTIATSYSYYFTWTIQSVLREYEQTGTVFGAINKNQFEALQVLEPDANSVDAFDSCARHLDARIRSSIAESLTLTTLRDALLPKLISGELRTSNVSMG